MPEQDPRIRSAIHRYAQAVEVSRPSVDMLLAVRPTPPPERVSRVRTLVAVGVTLLLLVGAVIMVRRAPQGGPGSPDSSAFELARRGSAVVWPLAEGNVSSARLKTAVDAAEAYVRVGLGLGSDWRRDGGDDGAVAGHVVEERYVQERGGEVLGGLRVWLAELDGLWFVTGSAGDDGPVITDARVFDGMVQVEAVPPNGESTGAEQLTLDIIGVEGALLTTATVDLSEGQWLVDVPFDAVEQPGVVRVTMGDGGAGAQATSVILPVSTDGHAMEDLFPAAIGGSYYAAWVETLHAPSDWRSDWMRALTSYIGLVGAGILSVPLFDQVAVGREGKQLTGRFRTTDGGSGTFEIARLEEGGPWFLISLRDDAVDLRETRLTASEVEVTIAVSGTEAHRYTEAFQPAGADSGVAAFALALTAPGDGVARRFYDAWGPPEE